jgi:hypothetical protein
MRRRKAQKCYRSAKEIPLGIFLYRPDCLLFDTLPEVPPYTEARIKQLCTEALAAKTQADVDRILPELRSALEEHVRLAKDSLEAQVTAITAMEAIRRPRPD